MKLKLLLQERLEWLGDAALMEVLSRAMASELLHAIASTAIGTTVPVRYRRDCSYNVKGCVAALASIDPSCSGRGGGDGKSQTLLPTGIEERLVSMHGVLDLLSLACSNANLAAVYDDINNVGDGLVGFLVCPLQPLHHLGVTSSHLSSSPRSLSSSSSASPPLSLSCGLRQLNIAPRKGKAKADLVESILGKIFEYTTNGTTTNSSCAGSTARQMRGGGSTEGAKGRRVNKRPRGKVGDDLIVADRLLALILSTDMVTGLAKGLQVDREGYGTGSAFSVLWLDDDNDDDDDDDDGDDDYDGLHDEGEEVDALVADKDVSEGTEDLMNEEELVEQDDGDAGVGYREEESERQDDYAEEEEIDDDDVDADDASKRRDHNDKSYCDGVRQCRQWEGEERFRATPSASNVKMTQAVEWAADAVHWYKAAVSTSHNMSTLLPPPPPSSSSAPTSFSSSPFLALLCHHGRAVLRLRASTYLYHLAPPPARTCSQSQMYGPKELTLRRQKFMNTEVIAVVAEAFGLGGPVVKVEGEVEVGSKGHSGGDCGCADAAFSSPCNRLCVAVGYASVMCQGGRERGDGGAVGGDECSGDRNTKKDARQVLEEDDLSTKVTAALICAGLLHSNCEESKATCGRKRSRSEGRSVDHYHPPPAHKRDHNGWIHHDATSPSFLVASAVSLLRGGLDGGVGYETEQRGRKRPRRHIGAAAASGATGKANGDRIGQRKGDKEAGSDVDNEGVKGGKSQAETDDDSKDDGDDDDDESVDGGSNNDIKGTCCRRHNSYEHDSYGVRCTMAMQPWSLSALPAMRRVICQQLRLPLLPLERGHPFSASQSTATVPCLLHNDTTPCMYAVEPPLPKKLKRSDNFIDGGDDVAVEGLEHNVGDDLSNELESKLKMKLKLSRLGKEHRKLLQRLSHYDYVAALEQLLGSCVALLNRYTLSSLSSPPSPPSSSTCQTDVFGLSAIAMTAENGGETNENVNHSLSGGGSSRSGGGGSGGGGGGGGRDRRSTSEKQQGRGRRKKHHGKRNGRHSTDKSSRCERDIGVGRRKSAVGVEVEVEIVDNAVLQPKKLLDKIICDPLRMTCSYTADTGAATTTTATNKACRFSIYIPLAEAFHRRIVYALCQLHGFDYQRGAAGANRQSSGVRILPAASLSSSSTSADDAGGVGSFISVADLFAASS